MVTKECDQFSCLCYNVGIPKKFQESEGGKELEDQAGGGRVGTITVGPGSVKGGRHSRQLSLGSHCPGDCLFHGMGINGL